jgi:hypothetical protein
MTGPELFLLVVACYALAGAAFALAFVTVGVTKIDPAARGTSRAFRALILPGSLALWPFLAAKWARHKGELP